AVVGTRVDRLWGGIGWRGHAWNLSWLLQESRALDPKSARVHTFGSAASCLAVGRDGDGTDIHDACSGDRLRSVLAGAPQRNQWNSPRRSDVLRCRPHLESE